MSSTTPAKEPLIPEPLISRQLFQDWNQACRVRQVSDKYDELLEKASDEGIPVDECMKKDGLSDMTQFRLSCPKFNMSCWPSELAELGSGVVLYFHFLAFLAAFLFLAFLIQVPVVLEYMKEDNSNLTKWRTAEDPDAIMMDNVFWFYSAGYLGPSASESEKVPLCYFGLVVVLCSAIIAKSGWQVWVDHTCDEDITSPHDFAIMVDGLPPSATNEEDILTFFKKNARRDGTEAEVVKVVIGWTSDEYRDSLRKMKQLKAEIQKLDPSEEAEQVKEKQKEMAKISEDLNFKDGTTHLHSSGVCVVSFRYQADMRRCVDRWSGVWASLLYCDFGNCCGILPGPRLPKFPIATGVGVYPITVRRAPNPGDINWDDLGVSRNEVYKKLAETNGCMFLIICVSFGITFAMATVKENTDNPWLGLLPALGLMIANITLVMSAIHLGEKEFHQTLTSQTASQALKMTCGMLINTGGMIILINLKEWQWYKKAGLVSDIFWLMGLTAVLQPLMQLTDMKYLMKSCQRRKLTDERIKDLKESAENYNANGFGTDKDGFVNFKKGYLSQIAYFKGLHEPSEMDMKKRYAYAVRNFVCSMLFCHIAPFISLVGIAGIAVQYWVDKRMLTSWYKYPSIQWNRSQADMSLTFIRLSTLVMPLCMTFFLSPSYKSNDILWRWALMSWAVALGVCIIPLRGIRWFLGAACGCCCRDNSRVAPTDSKEDYYQAQYLWPTDQKYHKSHGLYKFLPEKVNPEFLEQGVASTTKAEDVKSSYGASTAAALATASKGPTPSSTGPPGGTSTVTPPVVASTTPAPKGGDEPKPMGAPTGGKGHGKSHKSGGPCWEKEHKGNWHAFHDCCQDNIERGYQQWEKKGKKSGDDARITVAITPGDKPVLVSIDFEKNTSMSVKKKGHNSARTSIRRRVGP